LDGASQGSLASSWRSCCRAAARACCCCACPCAHLRGAHNVRCTRQRSRYCPPLSGVLRCGVSLAFLFMAAEGTGEGARVAAPCRELQRPRSPVRRACGGSWAARACTAASQRAEVVGPHGSRPAAVRRRCRRPPLLYFGSVCCLVRAFVWLDLLHTCTCCFVGCCLSEGLAGGCARNGAGGPPAVVLSSFLAPRAKYERLSAGICTPPSSLVCNAATIHQTSSRW